MNLKGKKMPKFKRIYVEITNLCNKNCSFCSKDTRKKTTMSVSKFEHVLKQIKEYTNYIYLHVKGEPLIHPKLDELLSLTKKYNIFTNITTNGELLSKNKEILTNQNIRQLNISLQTYKSIEIDDLFSVIDEILNKTKTIIVLRFWALNNNELTIENKNIVDKIVSHFNLDKCIIATILQKDNIKLRNNLYINKAKLFKWPSMNNAKVKKEGTCLGLKTHIGILSDGTVVPCCLDSNGVINLGNIFENSLYNILQSIRTKEIRKNFQNNRAIEPLCQHCEYKNMHDKQF